MFPHFQHTSISHPVCGVLMHMVSHNINIRDPFLFLLEFETNIIFLQIVPFSLIIVYFVPFISLPSAFLSVSLKISDFLLFVANTFSGRRSCPGVLFFAQLWSQTSYFSRRFTLWTLKETLTLYVRISVSSKGSKSILLFFGNGYMISTIVAIKLEWLLAHPSPIKCQYWRGNWTILYEQSDLCHVTNVLGFRYHRPEKRRS